MIKDDPVDERNHVVFDIETERRELLLHTWGKIELLQPPSGVNCDAFVCRAARVSRTGLRQVFSDEQMIRHLIYREHLTPFEFVDFAFYVKLPIFVARQWVRHRTASIVEKSGRSTLMKNEFYVPTTKDRIPKELTDEYFRYLGEGCKLFEKYEELVVAGVPLEMARIGLPQNVYTEMVWKCDLRNILHFLELRLSRAAQEEIRDYATAMLELITPHCPLTIAAWREKNARLF